MRIFRPENSLAITRNLWLILLSKILLFFFFKQSKKNVELEGFQICNLFFCSFSGC
jgi:hypothetical protein